MKTVVVILFAFALASAHAAAVEPIKEPVEKPTQDEASTEINTECYQPKEIGRCFAIFTRYAFNPEKHNCEEFIYGGCAGNSNNFETRAECESKCMTKTDGAAESSTLEASTERV